MVKRRCHADKNNIRDGEVSINFFYSLHLNETIEPFCEISDVLVVFRILRRSNIERLQQIARKLHLLRNDSRSPNFVLDVIDLEYKLPF